MEVTVTKTYGERNGRRELALTYSGWGTEDWTETDCAPTSQGGLGVVRGIETVSLE